MRQFKVTLRDGAGEVLIATMFQVDAAGCLSFWTFSSEHNQMLCTHAYAPSTWDAVGEYERETSPNGVGTVRQVQEPGI